MSTRSKVAEDITTNTTSAGVELPSSPKTFVGVVTGTGALTQTLAIHGGPTSSVTQAVLVATITLSGTTVAAAASPPVTGNFMYWFVISTATTGTGATGVVYAIY